MSRGKLPRKDRIPRDVENVKAAVDAVKRKELSLREAGKKFGISHQSLHRRVQGRVALDGCPGHPTALMPTEEAQLKDWLAESVTLGIRVRGRDIMRKASDLVISRAPDRKPFTYHWLEKFFRRHPETRELVRSSRRRRRPFDETDGMPLQDGLDIADVALAEHHHVTEHDVDGVHSDLVAEHHAHAHAHAHAHHHPESTTEQILAVGPPVDVHEQSILDAKFD